MKRVLWVASTITILVAGIYILQLAGNWEQRSSPAAGKIFAGFSAGQARHVQFEWSANSQYHLTDRERRDQALDWLLLAALSQSGLQGKDLMQITFDLPPVRARFIQPIAAFDYGATRSRSLGHGQVLAVVPVEAPEQRDLSLAHIADEHRKDTGRIPEKLLVFEYRLDPDWASGELIRRPDIDGPTLFTETARYREATVGGISSLRDFLAGIDDLTYVGTKQDSLVVGGRRLNADREPATAMTVDDVAALWQSQKFLSAARAEVGAFNAKWGSKRYTTEAEKQMLEAEYDREWKELDKRISPERRVTSSGFSLDPTFDYDGLLDWTQRTEDGLKRIAGASDEDLEKIRSGLRRRNEGALYEFLDRVHKDKNAQLADLLEASVRRYSFQAARYDGALRGTRAGMTLFYTDLVAKLKALEFWDNAPIDGFRPLTRVRLSPVFKREIEEHNKTRLWFGTQDRGFQASDGQILFARNATRIYAASANTFTPGTEVEPNAESEEFLGWWNNHYEEVARYEPEYNRLNQIMKWSLALTWLNQESKFDKLSFLADYNVDHSNWFPDWARKNTHLKFTNWDRVPFYPPHYKGSKTESLPLLHSNDFVSFGGIHVLSGGVSLAREDLFEGRARLPRVSEGKELVLRSGLDYQTFNSGENTVLKTLDNGEHEFQEGDILSRARKEAKFREAQAELRNSPVERRFRNSPGGLRIDIKVGEIPFGRFSTTTSGDTIKIGFEELDFDRAHDVAEEISAASKLSAQPEEILASNRDVQYVIGLDCEGCYAVKLRGSNSWAKFAPEGEPQVDLASGWDSRAGAMNDDAPTINIAMLDRQKITNELQSGRLFVIEGDDSERAGAALRISNRGPPNGATPTEVHLRGTAVQAERGPDGKLYIAREHLPQALQHDPDALVAALSDRSDPARRVANELQNGDFDRLLKEIAADPAGTKQQVERFAKQATDEADHALAAGDDALAGRRIEGVMAARGRTPELLARKAIADVRSQPEQAVEEIRAALRASGTIGEDVFRPLNARLQAGDLGEADRANFQRIASMLDLHRTEQATHAHGDIVPELRNGIVDFHVRLTEPLPSATASAIDHANTSRPWYVLDNSSLALNDPAVRLRISMDLHAGHDLGPVVTLPRDDLAHFQPGTIETADGRKWVRVTEASGNSARAYSPYQRHSCASDSDQDATCERYPYLVEPKIVR